MKKMFLSRIISLLSAMSIAAVGFAGCGSKSESSEKSDASRSGASDSSSTSNEKITVRLADMSAAGGVLFSYAEYAGIIEKNFEGLNVEYELSDFGSGPAQNEAFASGSIDFSSMGNMPAITGVSNDYGYKIIGINSASDTWAALIASKDSGIESVADLKGKRVGTYIGGTWHYATGVYLDSVGLSIDEIDLLNTTSETATGIRSGELDAGVLSPATAKELEDEGSGTIIALDCGVPTFQAICGATDFTSQYPEVTQAVIKIIDETLKYSDENLDDYLAFYEEKTGADTTTLRETWDIKEYGVRLPSERDIETADDMIKWMRDIELISNDTITAENLFDLSFAEAAGFTDTIQ